ncbi:hypothetical protein HN011_007784 [Eciton burchellii]|nr:hypothetical protein HN011_007784 [Eciton burchellii]
MSMEYTSIALNATRVIDIHFKDLSYKVQIGYRGPKKQILNGLNGVFKCGELTAIMGPSGAGKSSLLNILTGFQQENVLGTVEYISRQGKLNRDKCKKVSCYIQQSDNLYDLFTVQESMMIASYLKIADITQKLRQMQVDDILNELSLTKAKNTRVNRLSGGQKKRLSIALELIDNPPIMFLDEPTTGLDSLASSQCISALQNLARSGRTIICTIHQPSAVLYQMFDYVYLVVDGRCIYAGKPDNTVDYFAKQGLQCPKYHNPADYMLEVATREYGEYNNQLAIAAKDCCQREEVPLNMDSFMKSRLSFANSERMNPPSEKTRFRVLLRRCVMLLYRDWTAAHMKIFLHFLVAVLLSLLYDDSGNNGNKTISNVSYIIVTILYIAYTSTIPAVLKFPLELNILRKERFNNWYQLRTYYVTALMTSLPLHIVVGLIYSAVSYTLTSQPMEWFRFYRFLLIVILTSVTAEGMGIGLGAILNPVNGIFVGSVTLSIMLILTGFFIFFNHMPVIFYYISYINYMKYAFNGLLQAVYGYHRDKLNCYITYCHYRIPSIILEELSMNTLTFWIDVVVLFGWFVIFRIASYKILKIRLMKLH